LAVLLIQGLLHFPDGLLLLTCLREHVALDRIDCFSEKTTLDSHLIVVRGRTGDLEGDVAFLVRLELVYLVLREPRFVDDLVVLAVDRRAESFQREPDVDNVFIYLLIVEQLLDHTRDREIDLLPHPPNSGALDNTDLSVSGLNYSIDCGTEVFERFFLISVVEDYPLDVVVCE
jgi:hypothetical protein